jgi:hypothetical protein
MNKLLPILFGISVLLTSCTVTPDFQRRHNHNRETFMISAKRPLVAACISQKLRETITSWSYSSYKVIESEDSILFISGEITVRIYDLEDSVQGTIITLYSSSLSKARPVIDSCREQLEYKK